MSQARTTNETATLRANVSNKISSWVQHAVWCDADRAHRIFAEFQVSPEKYITPNPGEDPQEEASRIYGKLKEDYGLRTVSEAVEEADDYKDQRQAHAKETLRDNVEDIDAGTDDGLFDDIADEYGEEWAESVVADEIIRLEGEAEWTVDAWDPHTHGTDDDETPGPRKVETADDVRDIVVGELENMSFPVPGETGLDAETVRMVVRDELDQRDAGTDESRDETDDDETPGALARLGSWLVGVGETLEGAADWIEAMTVKVFAVMLMILVLRAGRRALSVPVRLVAWTVTAFAIATTMLADDLTRLADDLGGAGR